MAVGAKDRRERRGSNFDNEVFDSKELISPLQGNARYVQLSEGRIYYYP